MATNQESNPNNKKPTKPTAKRRTRRPANKEAVAVPAKQEKSTQVKATAKAPAAKRRYHRGGKSNSGKAVPSVKIIPLGGLNEIGKNITVYECENDAIIVDCGLAFPDADMLGVDIVIPDFSYLEQIADKVRGVFITHGHEDHIGAVPYLLKRFDFPIYGTRLALGLIEGKLKEHGLLRQAKLHVLSPRQSVKAGGFEVEFIRVNHSIPDAVAMAIHCKAGTIVQTGDFKIDYEPIEGEPIDLARFAELGRDGVLALLSDSTNAEKPGFTTSERKVGATLNTLFNNADGKRIIVASFASNIHRVQQIIDSAVKHGRKVAVSGRSMINVVGKAVELGYLHVPANVLVDLDVINRLPPEQVVLITTGSQGEPLSALARMANSDHRKVTVTNRDVIIISATPIPGNEKHVTRVINDLLKLGAEVIYDKMYEVHVSGHACQEEQKIILSLTRPQYFLPVHGEYKHLKAHAKTGEAMGVAPENIHIGEIGQVIELSKKELKCVQTVEAGGVFVDGLGIGDVGSIVIRDRKHLAQDGLIIVVATIDGNNNICVAGPDIVSRGFVYVRESEQLMDEAKRVVTTALDRCLDSNVHDWTSIKTSIKDALSSFIYRKTKRSPMILPIIMEV